MTPEEREQLRRDLEAAGCPALARLTTFYGTNPNAECAELRSLLRREVWVATWPVGHCDGHSAEFAAFSSEDKLLDWMDQTGHLCHPEATEKVTIDAEVPDGQG